MMQANYVARDIAISLHSTTLSEKAWLSYFRKIFSQSKEKI